MRSVGIVSGGAASSFGEAVELGLDAFLTGEPAEHVMADAREAGVHFIAAGHYATETFGVRRLGELVAERFGVEHRFIDVAESRSDGACGRMTCAVPSIRLRRPRQPLPCSVRLQATRRN